MKLLFQDQIIEFEQTPSTEEVIGKINELLQNDFYFSHLVIDGEEILEDPEIYLIRNIGNVESIEVIVVAAQEFINNLLLSTEEYAERAIPHITTLAEMFYNNPSPTNWYDLNQLLEGIQWILSMIGVVDESIVRPSSWSEVLTNVREIQAELGNLEEALENTDTVLVGDILNYEILPVFEALTKEVKRIIDTEGTRYDLN